MTVLFNDTTEVSGGQGPRPMVRLTGGISDAVNPRPAERKQSEKGRAKECEPKKEPKSERA